MKMKTLSELSNPTLWVTVLVEIEPQSLRLVVPFRKFCYDTVSNIRRFAVQIQKRGLDMFQN